MYWVISCVGPVAGVDGGAGGVACCGSSALAEGSTACAVGASGVSARAVGAMESDAMGVTGATGEVGGVGGVGGVGAGRGAAFFTGFFSGGAGGLGAGFGRVRVVNVSAEPSLKAGCDAMTSGVPDNKIQ